MHNELKYPDGEEEKKSRLWILFLVLLFFSLVYWGVIERKKESLPTVTAETKVLKPEMPQEIASLQDSFASIAQNVKPAVVNLSASHLVEVKSPAYEFFFGDPFEEFFGEFFDRPERRKRPQKRPFKRKYEASGSGVIIDPKGYILTNFHVIQGAEEIKATLSGDREKKYKVKVIGKDPKTDLAIVKIKGKNLPYAELGDSDNIRIGDWVVAIGSPFGLEQTVTAGIISAKRQSLQIEGKIYQDLIQTDASINRGNSGGPLVNLKSEIIGINTAIYAPTGVFAGVGFAIPINRVKEILDELIHKGKVTRGWLGIEIKEIDDVIKKQFSLKEKSGALVNKVMKNSAAEKGGIKRGDVIIKFDGKKIKDIKQLQKIVSKTPPGKEIKVVAVRDGEEKILGIKLAEMPQTLEEVEVAKAKEEEEWLGMKIEGLTPMLRRQYEIDKGETGVVIVDIEFGSKTEEIGFQTGDLIKAINRINITSPQEFKKVVKKIDLSEGVIFDILRRGHPIYITYKETK